MIGKWVCTEKYCFNLDKIVEIEDYDSEDDAVGVVYEATSSMGEVHSPHTTLIGGADGRQLLAAMRMFAHDATKLELVDESEGGKELW